MATESIIAISIYCMTFSLIAILCAPATVRPGNKTILDDIKELLEITGCACVHAQLTSAYSILGCCMDACSLVSRHSRPLARWWEEGYTV